VAHGQVVGIYIAPVGKAPLHPVEQVNAVSGVGLEGDRYFQRTGSFVKGDAGVNAGQQATLIEREAIEAAEREYDIKLEPGQSRRNIETRGVALNHLVGKEFRVGQAVLRGIKLCEPCGHLENLTGKGVRASLIHRGGLRAQIVTDGLIRAGDRVEILEPAEVGACE
jgi:MOSC domain-containing protein YiiM